MTRAVSRAVHVAAPAEDVFALLADARRHHELDGSQTVRGEIDAPPRLALGSRFSMRMRMRASYRITNTVVEFEESRRIAWRHWAHHVWRWELAPDGDGTLVTETFEWEGARAAWAYPLLGWPERNAESIRVTLQRLADRFGASPTSDVRDPV